MWTLFLNDFSPIQTRRRDSSQKIIPQFIREPKILLPFIKLILFTELIPIFQTSRID